MTAKQSKPAPRGFDKELAEMEALGAALKTGPAPDAAQTEQLRKALTHRNNFLVSKAARMVADAELFALLPDALAAYDRFLGEVELPDLTESREIRDLCAAVFVGHASSPSLVTGVSSVGESATVTDSN